MKAFTTILDLLTENTGKTCIRGYVRVPRYTVDELIEITGRKRGTVFNALSQIKSLGFDLKKLDKEYFINRGE